MENPRRISLILTSSQNARKPRSLEAFAFLLHRQPFDFAQGPVALYVQLRVAGVLLDELAAWEHFLTQTHAVGAVGSGAVLDGDMAEVWRSAGHLYRLALGVKFSINEVAYRNRACP